MSSSFIHVFRDFAALAFSRETEVETYIEAG